MSTIFNFLFASSDTLWNSRWRERGGKISAYLIVAACLWPLFLWFMQLLDLFVVSLARLCLALASFVVQFAWGTKRSRLRPFRFASRTSKIASSGGPKWEDQSKDVFFVSQFQARSRAGKGIFKAWHCHVFFVHRIVFRRGRSRMIESCISCVHCHLYDYIQRMFGWSGILKGVSEKSVRTTWCCIYRNFQVVYSLCSPSLIVFHL